MTDAAYLPRCTAACPAEFAPPTTNTAPSVNRGASEGEYPQYTPLPERSSNEGMPRRRYSTPIARITLRASMSVPLEVVAT